MCHKPSFCAVAAAACAAFLVATLNQASASSTVVINYSDLWKFNTPLADPGTSWRGLGFDDSSWSSGAGLFGFESGNPLLTGTLPYVIQTPVGAQGSQMTYLFRKTFTYNGGLVNASIAIDQMVDDGVAYYLNGNLLGSVGYTPGGAWDAGATRGGDATEELNAVVGPATGLVSGTNVLTAEVHQTGTGSSDMLFGARITISDNPTPVGAVENYVQAPRVGNVNTPTYTALTGAANLVNSASLSSASTSGGSSLQNLRDGVVYYDSNNSWTSTLQEGGRFRATWGSPQTFDRIWIYCGAFILTSLNHGILHFSDGTHYEFGPVPDHYETPGLEVSFPPKTATWVEVEITSSRNRFGPGAVVGEFAVFNGMPAGVTHTPWNLPNIWHDNPPGGCPFSQSSTMSAVRFTGRHIEYEAADTWYPSWASDDNLYSPYADGSVLNNGVTCYGASPTTTGNVKIEGSDPYNLKITALPSSQASTGSYDARYPCGTLCYNGVWYYGTYVCNENSYFYTDSQSITHETNWRYLGALCGFRYSTNNGQSWTDAAPYPRGANNVQGLFNEPAVRNGAVKFGTPHFVDFGKNMQYSPDGKAYIVGHGALDSDPTPREVANCSWITGDSIFMARVTPSIANMNDQTKWEYFAGMSGSNPIWSSNLSSAQPIADWNNHMGCVTITYNAPLHKYFMCVVDGRWTCDDMDTYIMESDNVYGPWKMVSYMAAFGTQGYFATIPSKFISSDGKKMWLSYSANFRGYTGQSFSKPEGGRYAWCLAELNVLMASDSWRTTNFGTYDAIGNASDLSDPDHDGLANLMEFALNKDPNKPSSAWGSMAVESTNLTLTYTRRKTALSEMSFACLWATDLAGPWSNTGVTEQIIADDGTLQNVKAIVPASGAAKKFFKLQVSRP